MGVTRFFMSFACALIPVLVACEDRDPSSVAPDAGTAPLAGETEDAGTGPGSRMDPSQPILLETGCEFSDCACSAGCFPVAGNVNDDSLGCRHTGLTIGCMRVRQVKSALKCIERVSDSLRVEVSITVWMEHERLRTGAGLPQDWTECTASTHGDVCDIETTAELGWCR